MTTSSTSAPQNGGSIQSGRAPTTRPHHELKPSVGKDGSRWDDEWRSFFFRGLPKGRFRDGRLSSWADWQPSNGGILPRAHDGEVRPSWQAVTPCSRGLQGLDIFFFCLFVAMKTKACNPVFASWASSVCSSPTAVVLGIFIWTSAAVACWSPWDRECPQVIYPGGVRCGLLNENQTYPFVRRTPPHSQGWDTIWTDGEPRCLYLCDEAPFIRKYYAPGFVSGNPCWGYP